MVSKLLYAPLLSVVLCILLPAPEQWLDEAEDPRTARLDSLMQAFASVTEFSGAVLVGERGTVLYEKAFGLASREWNVPNTVDTRFRLASLSKQFTALLIMQLAQDGTLSLDDPVKRHVPELSAPGVEKATVRQLLSHTSGIPNYHVIPDYDGTVARLPHTRESYLALFKDAPLLFTPGTQYQYTNLGYFLLALIAERTTHRSFNTLLNERIFAPAGMWDTYTEDTNVVMERSTAGYENVYTHFAPAKHRDPSSLLGGGGVSSTVGDLFKYDQALRSGKLLPLEAQRRMYTPVLEGYGYGWMVTSYPVPQQDSVTLVYHDGGNSGASTVMYRFLENDRCVIVLSNVSPTDCYAVARGLGRILHGRAYDRPKRSLVQQLARTLERSGIAAAQQEFRTLRKNTDAYELDGVACNLLGYHYLRSGRLKEAVAVFELNVEAFPDVGDPYDSLAEAYMAEGRNELAITNYKRSLELDPNNSNARVMLEKLGAKQ